MLSARYSERPEDLLIVATADPSNVYLLEAVAEFTGFRVEAVIALVNDIDEAIERHYGELD